MPLARSDQFVAGRKNRHARFAPHEDLGQADRGQRANLARTQKLARAEHGFAARNVTARDRHGLSRRHRTTHFDQQLGAALRVSVSSTMTMASAPRGSIPPVAMIVAVPSATVIRGSTPGVNISGLRRSTRGCSLVAPDGIGRAHGKAIHAGSIKTRNIDAGDNVT